MWTLFVSGIASGGKRIQRGCIGRPPLDAKDGPGAEQLQGDSQALRSPTTRCLNLTTSREPRKFLKQTLPDAVTMDPLSVTASIVGLLTAAGKIHGLLETLSSVRNAPTTIRDAQRETRHTEIALRALQRFLQRLDPTNPRLELIQVDELRIVLADAMLVFSSFESMLQLLARLARVRAAISWAKYSKQIDEHTGKLERYKSSLSFMLSILQWYAKVVVIFYLEIEG